MSKSLIEWEFQNRQNQVCKPRAGLCRVARVPRIPSLRQFLRMSNRVSALSSILRSPTRILGIVLMLVFTAEVGVMFLLPHVMPEFLGESGTAVLDAVLLTMVCAPVLWWVIIGPLRRIAIQEHQRSETIVANASEGIITFDSEGRVASCNRASSELLGVDPADWVGKTTQSRMPDFPRSFETLPCEFRLNVDRQDGTSFPVQVSVSEYPSETGQLRIAILRDLTEFERAERERLLMARETEALRAQQMATLAQLATGVAHEIRNPLTSIKMLIQVNRSKFADEGLPTDDLELVEHEIRRMERSVNGLLDYARPEHGESKTFPIQDAIGRTVQLIDGRCGTQNVNLALDCPDAPIYIDGDLAQLQQLLLNLTLNSLDAMPEGGELAISVTSDDSQVEVTVADTGDGISDAMLNKLFTPFATSKPNGVGLGLGICRRIAQSHHGSLVGSNRIPRGAQFRLTLPIAGQIAGQTDCERDRDSGDTSDSEESCKAC
ncbi:Sporulation kinase D [Stieleria magnilauensis]|uniref:histidine kinase n=2 Tax=Stieleria magnilauensis TaxID=2527963 RepID=A0ABX5Y0R5_9BACT|nr:Sporulation kinase D [Planctomycetes bacterium TBK1r]